MPAIKIFTPLFPGGKGKALTLSYDDAVRQDYRLVEMLNKYQIKGTFNLGAGLLGEPGTLNMDGREADISRIRPEEINELYRGHEVAGHGYTHMALNSADTAAAMYEIITERSALEKITGTLVRGFAYPFGVYDEDVINVLRLAGVAYARTVESTREFGLPDAYLAWDPTCHHNDEDLMPLAKKFISEPQVFYQPQLFYLWGHSYEFDQHDNWHVMESFLAYMAPHSEEVWFATNIEIIDYLKAYKQLQFSADGTMIYNPTVLDIWIDMRSDVYTVHPGETITLRESKTVF